MGLLQRLRPDERRATIHGIDLESLRLRGIRGLIVDLDNTLVPWNDPHIPDSLLRWLQQARSYGFRICVLSNNTPGRVADFCGRLGIASVAGAIKPLPRGYARALAALGTAPAQTAVIGDQLFTDILGGRWVGCYTILVEPISRREFVGTRLARWLQERIIGRMESP